MENNVEEIRKLRAQVAADSWDQSKRISYSAAVASLTVDEGELLAREALAALENGYPDKIGDPKEDLLLLADGVPSALRGVHDQLIDRGVLYPGKLYRSALSATRDRLIELLETTPNENSLQQNKLLICISWVGDEVVVELFGRWRKQGRQFSKLHVPPWRYANEAGWDLDEHGHRRNLFSTPTYSLVPPANKDVASTVIVIGTHEERCQWCARPLQTLLELDLTDERVAAVVKMKGRRLRIAHCYRCSCFGVIYTYVDGEGGSRWSDSNRRPSYLPDDDPIQDYSDPPPRSLVLGEARRSPFGESSKLGGFPSWINDADHPPCPKCKRLMPVIGQVQWDDFVRLAEGATWAFLCVDCGTAATHYDQT